MSMRPTIPAILLSLLLAGCAMPSASAPLFQKVLRIEADGTAMAVTDHELSPFQKLLRSHLPKPSPQSILAIEIDQPDGDGSTGTYLAVLRGSPSAELRYYEQSEHAPRLDRYYYRPMSAEEVRQLEAFLKTHPVAQMGDGTVPPKDTATQATTAPGTMPSDAGATVEPGAPARIIRVTDAQPKVTRITVVDSPAKNSPPDQLATLLNRFRQSGIMTCSYFQPYPPAARMLFGDPHREVLQVWAKGDDVRAVITAAPAVSPEFERPAEAQWLAFRDNHWTPSEAPPEPEPVAETATTHPSGGTTTGDAAVAPAVAPAVANGAVVPQDVGPGGASPTTGAVAAPATLPAPPPAPSPFSQADLLPTAECWWTQAGPNFTTVWHYLPLSRDAGLTLGFVVPTFLFDADHMAVDAKQGMLYMIHEGQLFSLPIPKRVLAP